jgi:hypothetical protein
MTYAFLQGMSISPETSPNSIDFNFKEVTPNAFVGLSIREDYEKIMFAQEGIILKILMGVQMLGLLFAQ